MTKMLEMIGIRFDKLLVIKKDDYNKFGQMRWLCVCDCGAEKIVTGCHLTSGQVKSCGCMKLTKDLVGQQFGSLMVLSKAKTSNERNHGKYIFWLCRCSCGKEKVIRGDSLKANTTSSCGCLHPRKPHSTINGPKMSSAKIVYRNAYNDGDLIFEDFYKLTQLPCYYCGAEPQNKINIFLKASSTDFSKEHGLFIYNGLDRIDSNLPHDKNNVVTCCYPCNWSKAARNINDFESWIVNLSINLCKRDNKKLELINDRVNSNK